MIETPAIYWTLVPVFLLALGLFVYLALGWPAIKEKEDVRGYWMAFGLTDLIAGFSGFLLLDLHIVISLGLLIPLFFLICLCLWLLGIAISSRSHASAESSAGRFGQSINSMLNALFGPLPKSEDENTEMVEWKQVENLEEDEQEVLRNALEFTDTSIDEIMTHRSDVVCLSLKDDPQEWKKIILENRHTFYPVTNEDEEDIIGVLDTRDYFRLDPKNMDRRTILKKTMEPPYFAAENMDAMDLVQKMKQQKNYFAIVLDEYGGMSGIVTIHDILEELLGEMDEEETSIRDIIPLPNGGWKISGKASLEDVSKALGRKLELDDFETFSGYVLGTLGYIPEDGSQFECTIEDMNIAIKNVEGHRIAMAILHMNPANADSKPSVPAGTNTRTPAAKSKKQ